MTFELRCYMVIDYSHYKLHFFCYIISIYVYWLYLVFEIPNKEPYFDWLLWDVKISTCQYGKTTGPICMKFIGCYEWAYRGLYTNFQSILKVYKNIGIFNFKGYMCFLWSYMYAEKLKELSNLLNWHENELTLA